MKFLPVIHLGAGILNLTIKIFHPMDYAIKIFLVFRFFRIGQLLNKEITLVVCMLAQFCFLLLNVAVLLCLIEKIST